MSVVPTIRCATPTDAAAVLDVYAPIVRETSISFELEPPSVDEMARRIRETLERYPWLIAEDGDGLLGYAYAHAFRARPAYQWSAETSVYVAAGARRRGVATALYTRLFGMLERQGFTQLIAGITLPNPGSVALHERFGFRQVAHLSRMGHKFGRWHDVGFWQKAMSEVETPRAITPICELPAGQ